MFWQKLGGKLLWSGLLILASVVILGTNLTPVQAQDCEDDPNFQRLNTCINNCDEMPPGTETYTGYFDYVQNCLITCEDQILDRGGTREDYIDCTEQCQGLVDSGYFGCTNSCVADGGPTVQQCLCENDVSWLADYPHTCAGLVQDQELGSPNSETTGSGIVNFIPECGTTAIAASSEGLVDCIRSVVNYGLLVGIIIFFIRVVYITILSTVTFGSAGVFKEIRGIIRDLIVGIAFVAAPVLILALINPLSATLSFNFLEEFNFGPEASLVDISPDPTGCINFTSCVRTCRNTLPPGDGLNQINSCVSECKDNYPICVGCHNLTDDDGSGIETEEYRDCISPNSETRGSGRGVPGTSRRIEDDDPTRAGCPGDEDVIVALDAEYDRLKIKQGCAPVKSVAIHWSGGSWTSAESIHTTLNERELSCQFSVDPEKKLQGINLYEEVTEIPSCVLGDVNNISIEIAGVYFDAVLDDPDDPNFQYLFGEDQFAPPFDDSVDGGSTQQALELTCWALEQYDLPEGQVIGHFEYENNGNKSDPGQKYIEYFRQRVLDDC